MRQTKIVATFGPASETRQMLPKVLDAGVDVVRLNFSHGTYAEMTKVVADVRAHSNRTGRVIGIMQDLQGPKVRVGLMADDSVLRKGRTVTLTTKSLVGNADTIPLQYKKLPADVKRGDTILLDDGQLELRVLESKPTTIRAKVVLGGLLKSHKGINVPSASLSIPALTTKDLADLKFGLKLGVDFVALSFVKTAADIEGLRRRIKKAGYIAGPRQGRGSSGPQIVAKIEKHEAVRNIDEIIAATDVVMVARGDLGVELPPEEVPLIQKEIIHKANRVFTPVITATQMLESMVEHARATRAEVSDIANAVLDGSDAVMLSAETATGAHPREAVGTMARTADNVERFFDQGRLRGADVTGASPTAEAVSISACQVALQVGAKLIVVPTASGWSAKTVARHRIDVPILALTSDAMVARQLAMVWGVQPFVVPKYRSVDEMIELARSFVLKNAFANTGDRMVITAGLPLHQAGTTNMVQVQTL